MAKHQSLVIYSLFNVKDDGCGCQPYFKLVLVIVITQYQPTTLEATNTTKRNSTLHQRMVLLRSSGHDINLID